MEEKRNEDLGLDLVKAEEVEEIIELEDASLERISGARMMQCSSGDN